MKKQFILFTFSILSLYGHGQNSQTLRIDPRYARGGNASQFFDSVTYIPLETTKESLFGDIQHLQVSRHYFAFYDYDTKCIFIFDKQGKFHGKIGLSALRKNYVPGQLFSGLENFTLDKFSENVFIVYDDGGSIDGMKELAVFNADGRLIQSKKLSSIFNNLKTSFCFVDSNKTVFASEKEDTGSKYYFHIVKDFNSIVAGIVPKKQNDPMTKSWSNTYKLQPSSATSSIWSRLYDHTVYSINNVGLPNAYSVVLPQSLSLDSSFYKDSSIISNVQNTDQYLHQHRDKVSYLTGLYEFKNLFFFCFLKYNISAYRDSYFYSLKTKNLYSAYAITPDSLCFFLRIFNGSLTGADEDHIYCSVSSLQMFQAYEATKDKHPNYPPALQEYFKTQNSKGNPVIVQLKPKDNL
jgi:hypothetical protein